MGHGKQAIVDYLNDSLSQLSKTIIKRLTASIVAQNEKTWREIIFKDERDYDTFKLDEQIDSYFNNLKESLILMSLILRKYPELRAFTSELKVATHIFDTATLNFQELSEPQELTFLDYAIHIIQPPTFPMNAGLVTSFFERGTPAFTLKQGDEVVTSHEYFSRLIIQKCLGALRVLTDNKELETYKRRQLSYVYAQTIRNCLRSDWKASKYASQTNLEVISQLEEIITDNLLKGRTLTDLVQLTEVLRIQVREQIVNAYSHLNLSNAQENFLLESKQFTAEEYDCVRSILHFDRDYSKLEEYTNRIESDFKDICLASKIEDSKDTPLHIANIEDPNRKALLVRAILDSKSVCNKLAFFAGCPWDAYVRNYEETSTLTNSDPGSDPFRKVFESYRDRVYVLKNRFSGRNVYAETGIEKPEGIESIISGWGLQFTRNVSDKIPSPVKYYLKFNCYTHLKLLAF